MKINALLLAAFAGATATFAHDTGAIHLTENVDGMASQDSYLLRVSIGGTTYDECWKINRSSVALNTTYFPSASTPAEYWWTSDVYGTSTTNVWCANSDGGLGGKP